MAPVILVIGGARSGKSLRAESKTLAFAGQPIYIATAEARDSEMQERIAKHVARRGSVWSVREAPLDLAQNIAETDGRGARLVDCLTLWLSNLILADRDWSQEVTLLVEVLARQQGPIVLVSNEVGMGIVPDNVLARVFRDAAGTMNQRVARVADEVEFVVAGLPVKIK